MWVTGCAYVAHMEISGPARHAMRGGRPLGCRCRGEMKSRPDDQIQKRQSSRETGQPTRVYLYRLQPELVDRRRRDPVRDHGDGPRLSRGRRRRAGVRACG